MTTNAVFQRFWFNRDGLSSVEYALLVGLVGIVTLVALDIIGDEVLATYLSITSDINSAVQ